MNAEQMPSAPNAVCPVHAEPSDGPCARCGTFRCASCGASGLCVACLRRGAETPWFPTSLTKLAILYFASFGLYSVYWAYKHWKRLKDQGQDIWPIPRAIFLGFTSFNLFPQIGNTITGAGLPLRFNPQAMAALVLVANFAVKLPDPFWLVSFAQVIPLLIIQRDINALHERVAPNADRNSRFGVGAIILCVFGAIFWGLVILGLMLPEPAVE